jgi:hypothetical protein
VNDERSARPGHRGAAIMLRYGPGYVHLWRVSRGYVSPDLGLRLANDTDRNARSQDAAANGHACDRARADRNGQYCPGDTDAHAPTSDPAPAAYADAYPLAQPDGHALAGPAGRDERLSRGAVMCVWGTDVPVWVKMPAQLSHTGKERWKRVDIDACIADLVWALQLGGIITAASCCGHNKAPGEIVLVDGRRLIVEVP